MTDTVSEPPASGTLFELLEAVTYASHHDGVVVRVEQGKVKIDSAKGFEVRPELTE